MAAFLIDPTFSIFVPIVVAPYPSHLFVSIVIPIVVDNDQDYDRDYDI